MTACASLITFCGQPMLLVCDRRCDKAWGINTRPRHQLSDDHDDYRFFSDDELDTAPEDPGTYEGGQGKPRDRRHNKWCARECERCGCSSLGENFAEAPDLERPLPNIRRPKP